MSEEQKPPQRELVPVRLDDMGMLKPANLTEAIEISKLIAHSGMVPKDYAGKPGAVLVAMQMGHELGLSPMAAIQNIAVINGRPSLWGDALLALVVSRHDCEDVVETFDEKSLTATCTVKRRGRSPVERSFSMIDAKTAGLSGKQGPWTQYPKRMLQQRARGFALRDAFPDALRGIMSREEAGDMVVDVTPVDDRPPEGRKSFRSKTKSEPEPKLEPEAKETPTHDPITGEVMDQKQQPPTQDSEAGF
jgi:hypothetical protein